MTGKDLPQAPGGRTGPLRGLRVVEMQGVGPGPFAAMWLADMGADVIRIGRPGQGYNQTRKDVLNRGRRSLALDMKKPGATDLVLRLIDSADVLIEGYRPGVMERLGLGPEACLARVPRLVYGRITGWGREGPMASYAGHDINYLALTGMLDAIGPAEGRPTPPLNLVGDFGGGGMVLLTGILAALLERQQSGRGQVVDAAMVDGANLLAGMIWAHRAKGSWVPGREVNIFDGGAPYYGTYCCADGRYVALGCIEREFWNEMLARCGWQDDPVLALRDQRERWPEVRARLAQLFLGRTRDDWCALLEHSDACVSPVLSMDEALEHPHTRARSGFDRVVDVAQPAPAPRLARTPGRIHAPPPLVGEHSVEILRESGLSADEIDAALSAGLVEQFDSAPTSPSNHPSNQATHE